MFRLFELTQDTYIQAERDNVNFGLQAQLYIMSGSSQYRDINLSYPEITSKTLVQFDTNQVLSFMGGTASLASQSVDLLFNISNLKIKSKPYVINAYPITSSWSEGIGVEDTTNNLETFPFTVSDIFYDTNYAYPCVVDEDRMTMTISLNQYMQDLSDGLFPDNGLVIQSDDDHIYTLAMFSKDSRTELGGRVLVSAPPVTEVTGSAELYNSGSVEMNAIYFQPYGHNPRIRRGGLFQCLFSVENFFERVGFSTHYAYNRYLEGVQIEIFSETHGVYVVPPLPTITVPVNNGLLVSFNTTGFPYAKYSYRLLYTQEGITHHSERFTFWVEE
jgi:hypothetical protein